MGNATGRDGTGKTYTGRIPRRGVEADRRGNGRNLPEISEIGSHYIRSGKCRLNRSAFFIYARNCFAVFKRQRYRIPLIWIKAALRAGRLKENHPRYAPVFSFAEPCSKREIQENGAYKTGKTSSRGPLSTHKIKEYETTTHRRHM